MPAAKPSQVKWPPEVFSFSEFSLYLNGELDLAAAASSRLLQSTRWRRDPAGCLSWWCRWHRLWVRSWIHVLKCLTKVEYNLFHNKHDCDNNRINKYITHEWTKKEEAAMVDTAFQPSPDPTRFPNTNCCPYCPYFYHLVLLSADALLLHCYLLSCNLVGRTMKCYPEK